MEDLEKIDSLSVLDLDVEMLEERIEMSALVHPNMYDCGTNHSVCVSNGTQRLPGRAAGARLRCVRSTLLFRLCKR